ncbi:GyrI-like domain-containing protein [Spirosoma aerophilum]
MTTQLNIPEQALIIKETKAFTALCFTTRTTLLTMSEYAPGTGRALHQEAVRLGLEVCGPIQWIYTGVNGNETNEFQLEIVLPVSQPGLPSAQFTYATFPSFRCASHTYQGAWSDLGQVYEVLFAQLYRDGYQNDGYVREVYAVVDLENQANCVTDIQIGLV